MFGKELPLSALLHTFPNFTLPSLPSFPIGLNCSNKYHFLHRAVILTAQSRPPPHCYPVPSQPGATMKLLHLTGSCIFWGLFQPRSFVSRVLEAQDRVGAGHRFTECCFLGLCL